MVAASCGGPERPHRGQCADSRRLARGSGCAEDRTAFRRYPLLAQAHPASAQQDQYWNGAGYLSGRQRPPRRRGRRRPQAQGGRASLPRRQPAGGVARKSGADPGQGARRRRRVGRVLHARHVGVRDRGAHRRRAPGGRGRCDRHAESSRAQDRQSPRHCRRVAGPWLAAGRPRRHERRDRSPRGGAVGALAATGAAPRTRPQEARRVCELLVAFLHASANGFAHTNCARPGPGEPRRNRPGR